MDLRNVTDYFDFGNKSANFDSKFGLPFRRGEKNVNFLTSMDNSCVYVLKDLSWETLLEPIVHLDCTLVRKVVLNDVNMDILMTIPIFPNATDFHFLYLSKDEAESAIRWCLSRGSNVQKLGLFVAGMQERDVVSWTDGLPNLKALSLGHVEDANGFAGLSDVFADLESCFVAADAQIIGGYLQTERYYEVDDSIANQSRSYLESLGSQFRKSKVLNLGIEGPNDQIELDCFLDKAGPLSRLESISLHNLLVSANAANQMRNEMLESQCTSLRIENCEFESLWCLLSILSNMPKLQAIKISNCDFASTEIKGLEALGLLPALRHLEISHWKSLSAEFAQVATMLGGSSLRYLALGCEVNGEAAEALKKLFGRFDQLRYLLLADTGATENDLLAALPTQSTRLDFLGLRVMTGLSSHQLLRQFPHGSHVLSLGREPGERISNLLIACKAEELVLSDHTSIQELVQSLDDPYEGLVQLTIPFAKPEAGWFQELQRFFPNLSMVCSGFENFGIVDGVVCVSTFNGMLQSELLEFLCKLP